MTLGYFHHAAKINHDLCVCGFGWVGGGCVCVWVCCVRIKRPLFFFFVYREKMKPYILYFVLGEVEDKITGLRSSTS